jgi:hypothetical protein
MVFGGFRLSSVFVPFSCTQGRALHSLIFALFGASQSALLAAVSQVSRYLVSQRPFAALVMNHSWCGIFSVGDDIQLATSDPVGVGTRSLVSENPRELSVRCGEA